MSIKPRALTISKLVLLMGVASSWNTVFAQTPQIVDFLPQRYSMQNSTTAGVSVSFDQAMDGGTVLPENFLVYGSRTGYHAGTLVYDASAQTANFDPATPFQAGEVVTVVLTSGIQGSSGAPLSAPFQWSFYIQAVTGTATFNLDSTYAAGDGPHFVGIGDLNGDSALDLAIPNSRSHDVFSWLNLGGAGFNQHNINGVGQSPRALTVGDFDSDGDLDIAAANEVSSSVSLLNNDGAGVFTPRDTTLPVGGAPEHISNADLNGDGFLDLVTVDTDSNAISVLLNLGDGNFQSAVSYPVGARPQASFIADFNNDGFPDIVGSNLDDNNVSLLMNDGTGAFGPAQNFAVGVRPRAVQGHDFNQDGLVDLAVANRTDNTIAILLNLGSGTFSPPNNFPVGQDPFSISVGDLEGDLDADLVVSNRLSNDFYVLLNNGFGIFQIDSVYTTGSQPRGLNAGDFNGDGVLDIGVVNWGTDSLQIFLNTLLPNQAPGSPVLLAPNDLSFMNPNATPIVLSWTVPVDTDGDVLHFKIEIDDNSDFSSPTLTFDSAVDATGFTPTPPVDSNTASVAYDLTTPVADGLYWWRVTASDGQVSGAPSPARSLTVDSTSPVISAVVIHNPDFAPNWYNQGTTTAIDFGAVYDELNADKAQFNLGALGGVEEIQNIPSGLDQVTQKTVALSSAPDGAYTLSVTIFDQAGNQTDTNTTIALDGTPPTSTQASSPARSSQETFQVKWDGSGTDGNGSGLSGLYDVQVQVDGGAWTPWLTNFQGTSSQYQGAHGSTYAFEVAAHDNLGNIETFLGIAETVTIVDTTNDVTAPGPPVTLTASGSSPSPWQNAPDFQIVWQEPSEQSGIARALYKLGGAPVADFDTTGSVSGATSVTITATQENGQGFYLWFSDLNGNVDFQNRAAVTLRYDNTPPSGTLAGSPAISAEESFEVQWDGSGTDGNGSGLSGFYDVRVQVDGGIWTPWLTNFQGTSASYPGVHGETYGFEAAAHDAADNVEAFLAISETQTVVDTNANDTAAPGPPPLLTAGGLSPSRWQNSPVFQISWQEAADTSGIARALYKLGSAPTANFDTTGSVTSATSLIIMVAQEDGQNFYLWFEDQRGNVDFQNHAVLQLRYDSTLPDLVELDILNADFGPDWFNQGSSNVATVEINYDEKHLQRIRLEAPGLGTIEVEPAQSGIDVLFPVDLNIAGKPDGRYNLVFTLTDSAGNISQDSTEIGLDNTPPTGVLASSPDTSADASFLVSWGNNGSDGDGSGLSGKYHVRFQENGGLWQDWLTEFSGNSKVFNGEMRTTYGFEAAAIDNLGNIEPFSGTAESVTFVDSTFSDIVPPSVFHTQPLVVDEGQEVTIAAQVADNARVAEVILFYKQSGEVNFRSMPMTHLGGGNFQATLTAEQISTLGLNYFIRASDGTNFAFHPIANFESVPNNLSVRILGTDSEGLRRDKPQPAGEMQLFYRMFSVPLNLENKDPLAVLEDDLGSHDRKKWRLFQYDATSDRYREYPNVDPFNAGTALWLIVRDPNKTIDTGVGTTVVTNQPYEITLSQGWNDVAIPFQFAVDWSDVQVVQGNANDIMGPYHFEDQWQTPDQVPTLLPWDGYTIFSESAGVQIAILPIASQGQTMAKAQAENSWELRIQASCGHIRNRSSRLGASPLAATEWDELDYLEPPHISDFVSVGFPHEDWQKFPGTFVTDFRPPFEDGEVWHFEVATSLENQPVTLSFKSLESLPANFGIVLYDNSAWQPVDIRTNPEYTFLPDRSNLRRAFDLIVGTDAYVDSSDALNNRGPQTFFLSQNYPNPFNAGTSLFYKVSDPVKVEIKVLNILGQEIRRLVSKNQAPGTYRIQWDGRAEDGREISSGVYIIKLAAGPFQQVRKVILIR